MLQSAGLRSFDFGASKEDAQGWKSLASGSNALSYDPFFRQRPYHTPIPSFLSEARILRTSTCRTLWLRCEVCSGIWHETHARLVKTKTTTGPIGTINRERETDLDISSVNSFVPSLQGQTPIPLFRCCRPPTTATQKVSRGDSEVSTPLSAV
jgi:hypothetical protein